tara:strand:+ start:893 stop:1180 length:288 start_codon:yes stop_codon:yes gene_type:complete
MNIRDALVSLVPNAEWTATDTEVVEWLSPDIPQPTQDEIDAEVARLQSEYDSQEYARNRKQEYPSIEECVHAILDDDLDALQAKRAEIKARYPKS